MFEYRLRFRVDGCSYHKDEYDTATFTSFKSLIEFIEPLDCSEVRYSKKKKLS
jgi:hypothetical protein